LGCDLSSETMCNHFAGEARRPSRTLFVLSLSVWIVLSAFGEVKQLSQNRPDPCRISVRDGDTLYVDYKGWLEDGTLFGNSDPGQPYGPFILGKGEVIPGVDLGLQGMCLGETRTILIPPHLAYGDLGTENVPPKSTLKFEYHLAMVYPEFSISTIDRPKEPCMNAVGEGSEIGLDFSAYYSVYNSSHTVSWTMLHDTFSEESFWGPFLLNSKSDLIKGLHEVRYFVLTFHAQCRATRGCMVCVSGSGDIS